MDHHHDRPEKPVLVILRERWAEPVGIPPSGGLDEFDRKRVRNGCSLLALWEMGIRWLRVPLRDLHDPETCRRMSDLTRQGHAFTFFSYGGLEAKDLALIADLGNTPSAWETCFARAALLETAPALEQAARATGLPLYLSMWWSHGNTPSKNTDTNMPCYSLVWAARPPARPSTIRSPTSGTTSASWVCWSSTPAS